MIFIETPCNPLMTLTSVEEMSQVCQELSKDSKVSKVLLAVDNTKYKKVFGNPVYDSEEAVLKAIEWYKKIHIDNKDPWDISFNEVHNFIQSDLK